MPNYWVLDPSLATGMDFFCPQKLGNAGPGALESRAMKSPFLFGAALNGFLVVALGAFGAHALESMLSADMLEVYGTAVQYHMFHAMALVAVQLLYQQGGIRGRRARVAGQLFLVGIGLFCGSLYLLALSDLRWLGMVTPLGGLLFLAAWLQLARACAGEAGHD